MHKPIKKSHSGSLAPAHGNTKLRICGFDYEVIYTTEEECPLLVDNEGRTDVKNGRIYVSRDLAPSRQKDVLLHEVMHAFLDASGVGHFLASHVTSERYSDVEESLIRLSVQHLLRLVEDNGAALTTVPPHASDCKPTSTKAPRKRKVTR